MKKRHSITAHRERSRKRSHSGTLDARVPCRAVVFSLFGSRYIHHHSGTHNTPSEAASRNADRKPKRCIRYTISGVAIVAPIMLPVLKIPMASVRSFGPKSCDTTYSPPE